jgi:hypothetical protein
VERRIELASAAVEAFDGAHGILFSKTRNGATIPSVHAIQRNEESLMIDVG